MSIRNDLNTARIRTSLDTARIGSWTLPHSTATNAYDLLNDVITVIREEPRRFDMGHWIQTPDENKNMRRERRPECGTTGCIAGWVCILTALNKQDLNFEDMDDRAIVHLIGPRPTTILDNKGNTAKTGDIARWTAAEAALHTLFFTTTPSQAILKGQGIKFVDDEGDGWERPVGQTEEGKFTDANGHRYRVVYDNMEAYRAATTPGTKDYAEAFAVRIRDFQREFADLLRARTFDAP